MTVQLPELPASTPEAMIEYLEGQLQEAKASKRELRQTLRSLERHEARIRGALAELKRSAKKRPPRPAESLDAHTQAGAKNVDKARRALGRLGPVFTMAQLGRASKVGTGTLTWAVRALEAEGVIEPTGNVGERRSREYRVVDEVSRRRARRMPPGS